MNRELEEDFAQHKKWVASIGRQGRKIVLDEVDLKDINFEKHVVQQGMFLGCNFDGLKINNVDFYTTWLCSSTFRETIINGCNFNKGELEYSNFNNSKITNTRIHKCEFWNASFLNTHIFNCSFMNNYCSLTDFRGAIIENVDFSATSFRETLFKDVVLKNISGIEEIFFNSINIGTPEEPIMLGGEEAKKWFVNRCEQDE